MRIRNFINRQKIIGKLNHHIPDVVIGIVLVFVIAINFSYKDWNNPKRVIVVDVLSYYAYLPATFIYHDLEFKFVEENPSAFTQKFWLYNTPKNKPAILTTMGLSVLYFPFFILAHTITPFTPYLQDGFSPPYKFALMFSSLVYMITGLFFLKKILLQYFNKAVTATSIFMVALATNLLYYTTFEATVSHAYNFSLITIFLFLVIKWYKNPGIQNTVLIGGLAGLITLIRPTNILVLLLFIFWDIGYWKQLIKRFQFFIRSYLLILLMIFAFVMVWTPQFIYWKFISGSFLYYSYGSEGGNFFFNNPQVFNQLFSYRKGWLLYTPVMIFALIGIIYLFKRKKGFFLPLFVYMLAMIYVLSSWWSWWNGGGYGLRSYIDLYGVLAIPLAAMIELGYRQKVLIRTITFLLIIFFTGFNLFQTWQYKKGIIHFDSTTKEVYWAGFLKTERPDGFYKMLEKPNYDKARQGIYETYPKKPSKIVTKENCFEATIFNIKNDPVMMKLIRKKAKKHGITIEEMMRRDAEWICKQKYKREE